MNAFLSIWNNLCQTGVTEHTDQKQVRYIVITNTLAFISIFLGILILFLLIYNFGWSQSGKPALVLYALIGLAMTLLLNRLGYYHVASLLFSWMLPLFAILISVISKIYAPDQITINDYFDFRFILLIGATVPLLVFSLHERPWIIAGLLPGFLVLTLFDPIHRLFGVHFMLRFKDASYFMTTALTIIAYAGMAGFIFGLKRLSDQFENTIQQKNVALSLKNEQLSSINIVVEEQKSELLENYEKLKAANKTIEEQKSALQNQNEILEGQVLEKTIHLSNTNKELTLYNNELRQFSHALSHNLKSPVSSLKGLINLLDPGLFKGNDREIYEHLIKTVDTMEELFKGLSEIIELRHELYSVQDKIDIRAEVENIKNLLKKDILFCKAEINVDDRLSEHFYSNKLKLHSILYNLINNALKYRHNHRIPVIDISLSENDSDLYMVVRDNGLGIDMENHKDKIFELYQRFHMHTEGKGMGLYLVKQQVESLSGSIEVDSRLNEYTEFKLIFPKKPEEPPIREN